MHNIENLVRQFPRIDVTTMGIIGYKRNVEGADVRYMWKALEEVMLSPC